MASVNLAPLFAQLGRGSSLFTPGQFAGVKHGFTGEQDAFGSGHGLAAGNSSSGTLPGPIALGPDSASKILDRQVLSSLENALQSEGIDVSSLAGQDFSPDAVAGRVLSTVQGFLEQFQQDHPEQATDEFFAQVRAGVEQGFNEARDVLANLGALTDAVNAQIDATYGLIQSGLDSLQNPAAPAPAGNGDSADNVSSITSASAAAFASISKRQSSSIQIETREGDIVTIDIFRNASADATAAAGVAGGDFAAYSERNVSASAGLSYSVSGDLNQDELRAIGKLLHRVDKVADKFFDGNIDAAFRKAAKLGFDTEQLASFSVDLQSSRTVAVAAAYQQTSQDTVPTIGDAVGFIQDAEAVYKDDTAQALFADPFRAVGDLFKGLNSVLRGLEKDADHALSNVVDDLTALFRGVTGLETDNRHGHDGHHGDHHHGHGHDQEHEHQTTTASDPAFATPVEASS